MATPVRAGEPERTPLGGLSACELLEGVPAAVDPIRQAEPFVRAFRLLDGAGRDEARNAAALSAFERAVTGLMREAQRVFHPPRGRSVDHRQAQRFLSTRVLGKGAVLRVGLERFEVRVGIAAAMALAACRADDRPAAVRAARGTTAAEAGHLKAFAALLLLEDGRPEVASELTAELGDDDGFLAAFVRAELAPEGDARRALRALAARRVVNPDQAHALDAQGRRHGSR